MSRRKQPSRSRPRSGRPGVPKHHLLPLPACYVKELSLAGHLTLSACQSGNGNRYLLAELARLTYLCYLLWEAGYGDADHGFFRAAEAILNGFALDTEEGRSWTPDANSAQLLERVIRVYDAQIEVVSLKVFAECRSKLDHIIRVEIPATLSAINASHRPDSERDAPVLR
ncbi:hypothetical protein SAMN05445504_9272 [Burkholderia sp. CF099]|nr:hypothetical protein SAMN05445504_9272 [Burkholderia sp. CF099]